MKRYHPDGRKVMMAPEDIALAAQGRLDVRYITTPNNAIAAGLILLADIARSLADIALHARRQT